MEDGGERAGAFEETLVCLQLVLGLQGVLAMRHRAMRDTGRASGCNCGGPRSQPGTSSMRARAWTQRPRVPPDFLKLRKTTVLFVQGTSHQSSSWNQSSTRHIDPTAEAERDLIARRPTDRGAGTNSANDSPAGREIPGHKSETTLLKILEKRPQVRLY